jgi:hypothetical protein
MNVILLLVLIILNDLRDLVELGYVVMMDFDESSTNYDYNGIYIRCFIIYI